MMMKFLGAAASAALLVSGSQAFAASLVIDDFSSAQWVQDGPTTDNPNNSEIANGVLGGARDLAVANVVADGDPTGSTELRVTGGNLKFSNVTGARGEGTITYDGLDGDATTVDTDGLGGVNLLIGTDPYFYFASPATLPFDNVADFRVTVWDMVGNVATYEETINEDFDPVLLFSEFVGIDFTQIGALQFFISSAATADAVDGAISAIEVRAGDVAPIPLPATGLLLLGGLGGLSFLRRRKSA